MYLLKIWRLQSLWKQINDLITTILLTFHIIICNWLNKYSRGTQYILFIFTLCIAFSGEISHRNEFQILYGDILNFVCSIVGNWIKLWILMCYLFFPSLIVVAESFVIKGGVILIKHPTPECIGKKMNSIVLSENPDWIREKK